MALIQTFESALRSRKADLLDKGDWWHSGKLMTVAPVLKTDEWLHPFDALNNCYNFGLNWKTYSALQPGDIWLDRENDTTLEKDVQEQKKATLRSGNLEQFANHTILLAEKDGLVSIDTIEDVKKGYPVEDVKKGYPVALVFTGIKGWFDFHWIGLRRSKDLFTQEETLSWAHKINDGSVMFCWQDPDEPSLLKTLFSSASHHSYTHFAGFFEVDPAILKARPGGMIEQIAKRKIAAPAR